MLAPTYIPAGKRESSVIGSIMEIMEMLCRRASLAVSSFARDSTGTKDLNGISELSRCYLKNEETAHFHYYESE